MSWGKDQRKTPKGVQKPQEVRITHPHHPRYGACVAVLGEMKVKGERRWVIAAGEVGQVSIPQSWTEACAAADATPPAAAGRYLAGLLQLAKVVQTLQETHPAKEQAHVNRPATTAAASRSDAAVTCRLVTTAPSAPPPTDRTAGDLAATAVATGTPPSAAITTAGGAA